MNEPVQLPLWLVWTGGILAGWALLSLALRPLWRRYWQHRAQRMIERLNESLSLRIPTYKMARRDALIGRLIADPRVLDAISEERQATGESHAVVSRRAEKYAREIVPAFRPYFYFRIGTWLAQVIAKSLYRVRLGHGDAGDLAQIDPKASVVFVMNHRSNMDYILLAYLAADQVALSYAVGEWAKVWPVSQLVRAMGAFFVRRGSGNPLYRRVLERYVQMATEGGVVQVVYPEGGLSRDGRLRPPKLGLLDYMVRAFDPHGPRDLLFIPIGVNYDRVLEDRSLLAELDPNAPRATRWQAIWRFHRFLWRNILLRLRGGWYRFGYAVVNYGDPLSLRAWIEERKLDLQHASREERIANVEALARDLMSAVAQVIPAAPAALVAQVFVAAGDEWLDDLEWKSRAHDLMAQLEARGANLYLPRDSRGYTLEAGLRMLTLRRLLEQDNGRYRSNKKDLAVLKYYANSIEHLLASRAPAAAAAAQAA